MGRSALELVAGVRSTLIANAWSPAKAAILERCASRSVTIDPRQSIVSITFDDVPVSAVTNAVPVLDEHEVKATFYVALGISGEDHEFIGPEHVVMLAGRGHQIGCHTLTHYSLRNGTPAGLYEDAVAGKRALESLLAGAPADHFAYPYGAVSVRAKALLQRAFTTMRTSTPGINAGRVDLSYLRAENLYSRESGLDLDRVRRRVQATAEGGGWLIFYTHGVSDDGDDYDTTRQDFRRAVEIVMESGLPVLPVARAVASIRSEGALSAPGPATRPDGP